MPLDKTRETVKVDLCVLGGGSAGLSIAAGAVQMGASVVLIESGKMGGDCLNTGCVPSKSLLSAAHASHSISQVSAFGVKATKETVNFAEIHRHIHDVIAQIAPHDSQERFEGLGCRVIREKARFINEGTVEAGAISINARRFVIATGSRPAIPSISGLAGIPYLTNENVFELTELPEHLIVIGGGPIGAEMAQAFCRLGASVTMIIRSHLLPKDDPDAVSILRKTLLEDGITLHEESSVDRVEKTEQGPVVVLNDDTRIAGSHLLLAMGRQPNVDGLGLDAAGIFHSDKGIPVDARLRTTNKHVFAAGDVIGGPQFTHWAGYHAGIILRNALFHLPAKASDAALPHVTYTSPEVAQVGLTEADAYKKYHSAVSVLRSDFSDNDRARAELDTKGFAKVIVNKKGQILGATIVGSHAGDLIQTWGLAISSGLKIGAVAGMIAPYPTRGEINKRAAGSFFTPKLFGPRTRWLVRLLRRLA